MGASGWSYTVPFRPQVGEVVEELRQEVFAKRDYHRSALAPLAAEELGLDPQAEPATVEELLLLQEDEGTHSIIDMVGVSATPGPGLLSPLTSEQLVESFGTTTPLSADVEAWGEAAGYDRYVERWSGVVVVGFDAARQPVTLHFAGFSGD